MEQWIYLRKYDRVGRFELKGPEWVLINTDKIEMIEEGDAYVTVRPPGATLIVAGTRVRVLETPEEIVAKMGGEWTR